MTRAIEQIKKIDEFNNLRKYCSIMTEDAAGEWRSSAQAKLRLPYLFYVYMKLTTGVFTKICLEYQFNHLELFNPGGSPCSFNVTGYCRR